MLSRLSSLMAQSPTIKTYNELITLESFDERLAYLQTYGHNPSNAERALMNKFYTSDIWRRVREDAITRDLACDMALGDFIIDPNKDTILVHHIMPITLEDVENFSPKLTDMNNLVTVSLSTHNLIHFYKESTNQYVERKPGDTLLWYEDMR